MKIITKNVGAWRILINRSRNDLSLFQFAIVCFLGYKAGLDEWYLLLLVPLYAVFKWYDIRKFHSQELDYVFTKNKFLMRQYKMIEEIHRKVMQ